MGGVRGTGRGIGGHVLGKGGGRVEREGGRDRFGGERGLIRQESGRMLLQCAGAPVEQVLHGVNGDG